MTRREARQLERELLTHPKNKTVNAALRSICFTLHRLAQQYVPNTPKTFADYSELVHCVKLLQDMGLRPTVKPEVAADVATTTSSVVTNALEFRQLRNKAIACLATIADLTEKPTATGTADYQRGMREGYRRASDIANLFLHDFEAGDVLNDATSRPVCVK
jgi:hypothetical protein